MEPFVILLVLFAGLLHSIWNIYVKSSTDGLINLYGIHIVSGLVGLTAIFLVEIPSNDIFIILFFSVLLHVIYKFALSYMYRTSEISQTFPFARGVAPITVLLISVFIIKQPISDNSLYGTLLICFGLMFLVIESRIKFTCKSIFTAMNIGILIGIYSSIDGIGAALAENWVSYAAWLFFLDSIVFLMIVRLVRGSQVWSGLYRRKYEFLISGAVACFSYGVFLWALHLGAIGVVAALREVSIIFVVILSVLFLNEKLTKARITSASFVFSGILLISMK